jgi:hypothetical protein
MTEMQIIAEAKETYGEDSPIYKAMKARVDRRNKRRRERYQEDRENIKEFMDLLKTFGD